MVRFNLFLVFIFTVIFLFITLPFFLYVPIPGVSMDTFGYFWFTREMDLSKYPINNSPIDIPYGYSFFLLSCKKIGLNIQDTVGVQLVIYFLSTIFLLYQFKNDKKKTQISILLSLTFFTINSSTLRYNFTLITESLYTSILILTTGLFFRFCNKNSNSNFILLSISIYLAIMIRSNGIILLLIPIIIIIHLIIKKQKYYPKIIIVIMIILIPNMVINYYVKGTFAFGEINRLEKVVVNMLNIKQLNENSNHYHNDDNKIVAKSSDSRLKMFHQYFTNFFIERPSYYYSLLKTDYEKLIYEKLPENNELFMFGGREKIEEFAPELLNYIFIDFDHVKYFSTFYLDQFDVNKKSNLWIYSIHILSSFINKSLILNLLFFSYFFMLIKKLIWFFKNKYFDFYLIIGIFHFISILILPFIHGRFQSRYIHVSEFIVFILGFIAIFEFLSYLNNKINDK